MSNRGADRRENIFVSNRKSTFSFPVSVMIGYVVDLLSTINQTSEV